MCLQLFNTSDLLFSIFLLLQSAITNFSSIHFFLNTINYIEKEGREKYGFKTTKHPPHIKEMEKFEAEMIGMVKEIKFRKMRNNIQQKIYEDMRKFKESGKIFVKSDKSGNLYKIEKEKYRQMIFKEVVKNYKKAPPNLEKELNNEAKMLAHKLGIVDRVEKYNTKNCFITIKDHKSNFKTNPECRLINPAKTQIGRISKIIVQEICESLRRALSINQWRSTNDCIKWFEEYEKDNRCSFIKYDIKDFYPSITEKTLDRALDLAKEYMVIPLWLHCLMLSTLVIVALQYSRRVFWFSFGHWLSTPWFFSRSRTRLVFSFFFT